MVPANAKTVTVSMQDTPVSIASTIKIAIETDPSRWGMCVIAGWDGLGQLHRVSVLSALRAPGIAIEKVGRKWTAAWNT